MTKFLRRTWNRYSKLGKRRKKKQIWRKPTGRDNKMREKRKGYPAVVSIGYKKGKKEHTKIVNVNSLKDLENIQKDEIVILGKMGEKKKIEFAKLAKKKKIKISNLNIEKFLKKIEDKTKKKIEEKKKAEEKGKKKKDEKQLESAPKGVPSNIGGDESEGKETDKQSSKSEELTNSENSEPLGEANKEGHRPVYPKTQNEGANK